MRYAELFAGAPLFRTHDTGGNLKINPRSIYLTDNGRALCGAHLGSSAKHTGRDISGQEIMEVTPEIAELSKTDFGYVPSCETCGAEPGDEELFAKQIASVSKMDEYGDPVSDEDLSDDLDDEPLEPDPELDGIGPGTKPDPLRWKRNPPRKSNPLPHDQLPISREEWLDIDPTDRLWPPC